MKARAVLLWLALAWSARAAESSWEPERTWVFAVGVLKFESEALHGWPEKGRKDVELLRALRSRGVPGEHIVFLKNEEATLAQIRENFDRLLGRTAAGDTLLFYYAGHGGRSYRETARPVHFVPYDNANGWPVSEIVGRIEDGFKGAQVLLTADCCHSGALAEEAARAGGGRIAYATLTSARASARSTGQWTFTQCLVDLFAGRPQVDLDRDGRITFSEAAQYADLEMAFHEAQRSTYARSAGFPANFVMSRTAGGAGKEVAIERCEGWWEGKWYAADIIAGKEGRYRVTWPGWNRSDDAWLAADALRPRAQQAPAAEAAVEVEWSGKRYAGRVIKTELGLLLVHYDGYPAADDEWVPGNRVTALAK
jgi:hypothetical protein